VALWTAEKVLFGPFRPAYTAKSTLEALLKPLFGQFQGPIPGNPLSPGPLGIGPVGLGKRQLSCRKTR
jgi:hypothetical protein